MISEVQNELALPICPNLKTTKNRLKNGRFYASPLLNPKHSFFYMKYGSFDPPDIITLNSKLPFSDQPLDLPEIPITLSYYTATHEVIHADDYTGGEKLYKFTKKHILDVHKDKLIKGMKIIEEGGNDDCIACTSYLASLWAIQYVDMLTHYRAYLVLRHKRFPRLDYLWNLMQNDFFPPSILTRIERYKNTKYIFDEIISRVGDYCIIDALNESESIGEKIANKYTV
jgi:hypothetical protein